MSKSIFSQSLDEYQWKNRLVLVITEDPEVPLLQEQVELFQATIEDFKDRKLKLLQIIPGKQREILPRPTEWQDSELFKTTKNNSDFEVVLIGLDGGSKFRESKIVQPEKIYRLIDSMPMRQAEMRRKNN